MTNLIKIAAITTIVYGFVLAFMIQDANMTYAIAARSLTASAAELSAYLWDTTLCLGGFGLYCAAPKLAGESYGKRLTVTRD